MQWQHCHSRLRHPKESLGLQRQHWASLLRRLPSALARYIGTQQQRFDYLPPQRLYHALQRLHAEHTQHVIYTESQLQRAYSDRLVSARSTLQSLLHRLDTLSPYHVLRRGYILAEDTQGLITSAARAIADTTVRLQWHDGTRLAKIIPTDTS